ncbi:MAG TPA: L,D-transpeptidase family protein [Dinghuibacter sp.]|uniref:L,D-transpeptidase family protein n=1 Tax=Dinghuibacter sp. TaxID=2024697 RepID=UPI002C401DCD|nr:L,D-transpeptidase family protein [Dinghuibacter sp.]HTJ12510.1 L,D-transpeptidase family protein [Dinghuibacter sp.]
MKNAAFLCLLLCACAPACDTGSASAPATVPRDQSITREKAVSDLFLDSTAMEQYIATGSLDTATAAAMRSFYNARNYQYAWFTQKGLDESGISFLGMLKGFVHLTRDSALFDTTLAHRLDDTLPASRAKTELMLTRQFLLYAQVAYAGRLNPKDLMWYIPPKKLDPLALLDSLLADSGTGSPGNSASTTSRDARMPAWEPMIPGYRKLYAALAHLDSEAANGGWPAIQLDAKRKFKRGDTAAILAPIRRRLFLPDSSARFDAALDSAVRRAQLSYGLKQNGVIDHALLMELNVPIENRIAQVLINLERMRWLPPMPGQDKIVANIPEFRIHVYRGADTLNMPIVVGQAAHRTVIFNDQLKYVVFSPYWNVPPSIVRREILPAMKRSPGYLGRNRMEITGYTGGLPDIRQKPGPQNSLGLVKFLFPNDYNIYFHDTPAKSLFSESDRAFSHGCIRLANAEKMADFLLDGVPGWTPDKIKKAMHRTTELWVTLPKPIPVYIVYLTAWVDATGTVNYRKDVYGHDAEMKARLFK